MGSGREEGACDSSSASDELRIYPGFRAPSGATVSYTLEIVSPYCRISKAGREISVAVQ